MRFGESEIVGECPAFLPVVTDTVSLDIAFVDDVDTVFVAQVVEPFLLRVVAGAHSIDVKLFPQGEIFQHQLFGNVVSGRVVMFVYVHAFHEYRLSVYEQLSVGHFDCTESDPVGYGFGHFPVLVFQRDQQRVQVRRFGSPSRNVVYLRFESGCAAAACRNGFRAAVGSYGFPCGIGYPVGDGAGLCVAGKVGHVDVER